MMFLQRRGRKGSGDLPGLQSRRFGPSRVEWWIRLPHASANSFVVNHLVPVLSNVMEFGNDWPPTRSIASRCDCGITCEYTRKVVRTSACRSWLCKTVSGTDASASSVASPCRNACSPIAQKPCSRFGGTRTSKPHFATTSTAKRMPSRSRFRKSQFVQLCQLVQKRRAKCFVSDEFW